jgi:hypothetical protein
MVAGTGTSNPHGLKMRCVLAYKPDPTHPKGKNAKAHFVILGYQHPELEDLETESPILGRTGKQWKTSRFTVGSNQQMPNPRSYRATVKN